MDYTRLYLVRHGEVVGHDELRYNGHNDVDITERGVAQMTRLADFLSTEHDHTIQAVYSSDLQRAFKGADIIAQGLDLKAERVHALRELHLGRWEGLTREEGTTRFPDEADFTYMDLAHGKLKGGESLTELADRVLPAIDVITERHKGGEVLCVLHGGVNRVILARAMGLELKNFFRIEQDYGCMSTIDFFPDGIEVVKLLNGGPNQLLQPTKIY